MSVRNSYDEIVVERADGTILRGQMWARNGAVTVTSSDGRQKTTWAGYSPRAIAKLMLIELEEARLGNPMFRRRNFNGHSSHSDCSGIPATACAREINVEERLHRQHWIERDVAMRANIAADIDGQIPPHSDNNLSFSR